MTIRDHQLDAHLGDFKDQLIKRRGQEGYEDLRRTLEAIAQRYPDEDLHDSRANAGTAASTLAAGDATLTDMAQKWRIARKAERDAMEALTGAILWEAVRGASQASIIEQTGLARATVAKAIKR